MVGKRHDPSFKSRNDAYPNPIAHTFKVQRIHQLIYTFILFNKINFVDTCHDPNFNRRDGTYPDLTTIGKSVLLSHKNPNKAFNFTKCNKMIKKKYLQ